ncbi:MAG: hypothetical protein QGH73_17900 [Rhodospirillales bacterium]|nr:hypothetical protein [Rhodospirillaceae bacterium]MDP6644324.1 hypothetical protein [Rhodospirillales bacterium]MDP6843547.1 hypothetical protein [Rhodospirillales bacterium]
MERTFLITSGAYVGPEFTSEFGQIPPAFLPVGNRRLYEHQAEWVSGFTGRRLISLPADFIIPATDAERLDQLGFNIISVPPNLSLGKSVLHVLAEAKATSGALSILHGDTLVHGIPIDAGDVVSEGITSSYYSWAEYERGETGAVRFFDGLPSGADERCVLSGYFSFSDTALYISALESSGARFIEALNVYAAAKPLDIVGGSQWLDFGHMELYHQSVAKMPTHRAFNRLDISRRTAIKSSDDKFQMDAEANWYETIPHRLSIFMPRYLGRCPGNGYETEYLYLSTLADLYVFGRLPVYVWQHIFQSCGEFMSLCGEYPTPGDTPSADDIYLEKTLQRLQEFSQLSGVDLDQSWTYAERALPGLKSIALENFEKIPAASENDLRIVHGDFCFSNIFYDFRANTIRTVDPRGHMGGTRPSIYGDARYDIAKLYHSVAGGYDFIIAGRYRLVDDGAHAISIDIPDLAGCGDVIGSFMDSSFAGRRPRDAASNPIAVLLYLSMLPLHADNPGRQRALLANALRLHILGQEGRPS